MKGEGEKGEGDTAESMKKVRLFPEEIRLGLLFGAPDPIPEDDLINYLKEIGFEEITGIPKIFGTEESGLVRANIARKGTCEVLYNPPRASLEVVGKNFKEVLDRFEEIKSMLDGKEEIATQIRSYQLVSSYKVFTKDRYRPLYHISDFVGYDKIDKFNSLLGEEITPFSIRLCPKSKIGVAENIRDIPDWFDIQIFPYVLNPQYYGVNIVFRNPDILKVKEFTKKMEDRIENMIMLLEGERDEK